MKRVPISRISKRLADKLHLTCNLKFDHIAVDRGELYFFFTGRNGNMFDSNSMGLLLNLLKAEGIISQRTATLWVGIRNGQVCLWCTMHQTTVVIQRKKGPIWSLCEYSADVDAQARIDELSKTGGTFQIISLVD